MFSFFFRELQLITVLLLICDSPRSLIFQLQRKVSKFNVICVSWSSSKTDLVTNIVNQKNRSFENVSIVTLSKYLTFFYLITYLFLFLNLVISLIELKAFLYLIAYLFLFLPIYFIN